MMVGTPRRLGGWWGPPLLFLLPAAILFGVFVAFPAIDALQVSLCKWSGCTPRMEYVGVKNFERLLHDASFWSALQNNFLILGAGGVVFFAFALLFAVALNHRFLRGRRFFQTLLFFPSFISVVGTATLWKLMYDPKSGLLNLLLNALGVPGVQWLSTDHAMMSIIAMIVWADVGGTMILLLAGMRRIPQDYFEAAEIDGAGVTQQFVHVTLPMMREVLIIALSLWMIGSMKIFGAVQALLAPDISPKCHVVATLQYEYAFSNRSCVFLMGRATAMAVVQVLLVLALVWLVRRFRDKESVEY